ncbi:MAG TPA: CHASE4 domain-containing protein [Luteolibacter sp.]
MSIKLRFALLLGVLLLIFLGSLGMLRMLEKEQLTEALASSQRDATEMLERWLDLNGSGLRQFAEDYSRWDDMVTFVKTRDPEWAEVNIRQSMGGFNAHAVWVLTTDGTPIYQTETDDAGTPVPVSPADWRQLVADNPYPHFFAAHGTGLLEIRAAPIQPSADANRTTPPQGWLLTARLWNQAHLDALGHLTESTLRLSAPGRPAAPYVSESKLTIMRPLNDWRGHTLDMLYVTRETPAIAHRLRTDAFEARVFIVFGLLVMGALGLSLHVWVLRPLNILRDSLARQDAAPLQSLIAQDTELARIASQLEISFAQRKELIHEVEERARLGRDLHDGVIQAIYAAGMGLAAARTLVQNDPAEATARIDQVRAALNETIRDVRNFITGLEPEALQSRTFSAAVKSLFEFFQAATPTAADIDIDESVADRLHLAARTTALQVIRECASNSIRHGGAHRVRVSLRLDETGRAARLEICDDGAGFDPATAKRGHGLDNIAERARTLGATAEITSSVGKGTRTTLLFPLTDLTA